MGRVKILFVHNWLSSFVRCDLNILERRYEVTELFLTIKNSSQCFRLPSLIKNHDLIFGWFASYHTLLPILISRAIRKPSTLVIGGYDLANLPGIKYGHQRRGFKRWISRSTMRLANKLTTFSRYCQVEAEEGIGISPELIYLGIPDLYSDLSTKKRESIALSVGVVNRENLIRKGHLVFIKSAMYLPDVQFILVGDWEDDAINELRNIAAINVSFTGWLDEDELRQYYSKASVYVQPSAHEGFGMSVAEAMLAGCIPVVSQVAALPEVVGDCGLYVDNQDPKGLSKVIKQALESPDEIRQKARRRILTQFPVEKRAQALYLLVDGLVNEGLTL